MFELGEYAKQIHEEVGKEIVKNKIDILITCGENAKYIAQNAQRLGMNKQNIYYFEEKSEIVQMLKNIIKKDDTILIKASHGMKFFELAEEIIKM